MKIITTTEERQHAAVCDTCRAPGVVELTPNGIDTEGRGPDAAARAHLAEFPDHGVSVTYVGVEFYRIDPRDMRYPQDRPGFLGEGQPWPCGRCGKEEDDLSQHDCRPVLV